MSARINNVKIGIFVIAGVVIFTLGVMAFGARDHFKSKLTFETLATGDVEGLSVGSPVKFRGVMAGKVTDIDFTWNVYPEAGLDFVVVEFEIPKKIFAERAHEPGEPFLQKDIKRGLRTRVKTQGVTGTSFLSIEFVDPATSPAPDLPIKPRHIYIPSAPAQLSQLLNSLERSLRNIEQLDMAQIGRDVSKVLTSIDTLVKNVDRLDFQHFGDEAHGLIAEVRESNKQLQGFLEEARAGLKALPLDTIGPDAGRLLKDVTVSNAKLQVVLDRLAGLSLAPLNQTLLNAREATENLNGVLRDLKQYPSGFLLGDPPPPARSLERRPR